MTRTNDADALPLLMDAMSAAWRHDATGVVAALDAAESHLGTGFHQSRQSVENARDAAHAGEWVKVWGFARQATNTITWAFPPDSSTCPPMPDPDVPGAATNGAWCVACERTLPTNSSFCIHCGERL
jgi:hypothetical protein